MLYLGYLVRLHHHCYVIHMSPSVNLCRACGWRRLVVRRQVAMQDTSPLVRANRLPIRGIAREILDALGGYRPGGPQHGVRCRQNLIAECGTQCQGRLLKSTQVKGPAVWQHSFRSPAADRYILKNEYCTRVKGRGHVCICESELF